MDGAREQEPRVARRNPLLRNPFVWFFLIGIATLTLLRPLMRHVPDPPPVLRQLAPFELIASDGKRFGSAELEGSVYVANFIFTRCGSICPLLTRAMARLQERYEATRTKGIRLISISVDPEYDTPERLDAYAAAHGADPDHWTFLTGPTDEVRRVVVDGFKTAVGEPRVDQGMIDIAHTGKFVIVDRSGGIRGYYDSDELGLDEIFHRSRHVRDAE